VTGVDPCDIILAFLFGIPEPRAQPGAVTLVGAHALSLPILRQCRATATPPTPTAACEPAELKRDLLRHVRTWTKVADAVAVAHKLESLAMRGVILFPRHHTLTTSLPQRLRIPQVHLLTSRYAGRRTIFQSARGATLPAELSPHVGTIFLGLIGLGFISTMLGVSVCLIITFAITFLRRSGRYEFYSSFEIWPKEVRADLRAGVKAKQQGNLALSRKLLTQCVLRVSRCNCY